MRLILRAASRENDHGELCRLAATDPHTRSFSAMMFSGADMYRRGWIRLASRRLHGSPPFQTVGFYCCRHKVREPLTELYFLVVRPELRSRGIGERLMHDLRGQSPHSRIGLNCAMDNPRARDFYERLGFRVTGEALRGTAWRMEWSW